MSEVPPSTTVPSEGLTELPEALPARARIWGGQIPGSHEPGFREQPIVQDDELLALLPAALRLLEMYVFRMGECRMILGREPLSVEGELRWHLSISHPDRHPTWDEIKTARYRLCGPHLCMAMILPPVEQYVNVPQQDHVFHLHEIHEDPELWNQG